MKKEIEFTLNSGHFINQSVKCPKCGGTNFRVDNYDPIWRDGNVMCNKCNIKVREYDAG